MKTSLYFVAASLVAAAVLLVFAWNTVIVLRVAWESFMSTDRTNEKVCEEFVDGVINQIVDTFYESSIQVLRVLGMSDEQISALINFR